MEVTSYGFTDGGMRRVYENEKWTIGIRNWKPTNNITGLDILERYNGTGELLVLLSGPYTLTSAEELENGWAFDKVEIQPGRVYNIPRTLWHGTVTQKDTKMVLIKDSSTGESNSDSHRLTIEGPRAIQQLVQSKQP